MIALLSNWFLLLFSKTNFREITDARHIIERGIARKSGVELCRATLKVMVKPGL
jgi:hypothetical protein